MISFSKTYFIKATDKSSSLDSTELLFGTNFRNTGSEKSSYAEKLSVRGLTFHQMRLMYITNIWVRSIVDKIVERVSDVAPIVKPVRQLADNYDESSSGKLDDNTKKHIDAIGELIVQPNSNRETFTSIRKKVARDLLTYDAAALELVKGVDLTRGKNLVEIFAVPGNTIKLNIDKRGILSDGNDAFVQVDTGLNIVTTWDKDHLVYMMLNPQSDRIYGLSPLESLVQTVTAELYVSQYNLDFFYNNATPRFAVLMEGLGLGQGNAALARFRTWWDNELRGQPHRPIVIGTENGKITFQKVGLTNEEMQFQEYSKILLTKIMVAYKMQPMVLGVETGTTSKTTSAEQVRQFKIDAVKPQMTAFTDQFNNNIIFNPRVLNYKDVYLDFDLDIIDKTEQAKWHEIYLDKGVVTINEIRTRALGLTPVPWGNVPYLQNNVAPFGIGPNGQAVPGDAGSASTEGSSDHSVPNAAKLSRSMLAKYLSAETQQPIGWENLPVSKRLEIVEDIIKEREQFLSKVYMIPNSKVINAKS